MAEYFYDLTREPPNLFIFRIVMQEPTLVGCAVIVSTTTAEHKMKYIVIDTET